MNGITLIPLTPYEPDLINFLIEGVDREFACGVFAGQLRIDLAACFDPQRRQYNGDDLLKTLHESRNQFFGTRILGILDADLFIPILTYIFGQAYLGGDAGIASSYRLKNERYGMPRDEDLFRRRFLKEILHELGHMFGLRHCLNPSCVMRSSTYVEDIDQKDAVFCPACRQIVDKAGLSSEG